MPLCMKDTIDTLKNIKIELMKEKVVYSQTYNHPDLQNLANAISDKIEKEKNKKLLNEFTDSALDNLYDIVILEKEKRKFREAQKKIDRIYDEEYYDGDIGLSFLVKKDK